MLEDAQSMGVPRQRVEKNNEKKEVSSSKSQDKLLRGVNIPYSGYDGRMKKRVTDARKLSKELEMKDLLIETISILEDYLNK